MKARGNTKIVLQKVGEIQDLVGDARGLLWNDQDPFGFENAQKKLGRALELCIEVTSMYEPVD